MKDWKFSLKIQAIKCHHVYKLLPCLSALNPEMFGEGLTHLKTFFHESSLMVHYISGRYTPIYMLPWQSIGKCQQFSNGWLVGEYRVHRLTNWVCCIMHLKPIKFDEDKKRSTHVFLLLPIMQVVSCTQYSKAVVTNGFQYTQRSLTIDTFSLGLVY